MPNNKDGEGDMNLGLRSSIRVGLVIAMAGVIWWAAKLTADVDIIKTTVLAKLVLIDELKIRVDRIDATGGQALAKHLEDVRGDIEEIRKIRRDLEIHIATTLKAMSSNGKDYQFAPAP